MSGMRYLYSVPGAENRVMHIAAFGSLGDMTGLPLCGTRLAFNRSINAPWGLGRPVCKHCLRKASA